MTNSNLPTLIYATSMTWQAGYSHVQCTDRRMSPRQEPYIKLKDSVSKPNRIEVIDHRSDAPDKGRISSSQLEISWQDENRTLKIFLNDV